MIFGCIYNLERIPSVSAEKYSTHCLKITQNVAFEFWHFPPIFVLLKLTCLVTLFDPKLQGFKIIAKTDHFWHF